MPHCTELLLPYRFGFGCEPLGQCLQQITQVVVEEPMEVATCWKFAALPNLAAFSFGSLLNL